MFRPWGPWWSSGRVLVTHGWGPRFETHPRKKFFNWGDCEFHKFSWIKRLFNSLQIFADFSSRISTWLERLFSPVHRFLCQGKVDLSGSENVFKNARKIMSTTCCQNNNNVREINKKRSLKSGPTLKKFVWSWKWIEDKRHIVVVHENACHPI